ncbi:hypothetical protein ACFO4E_07335 [Nocardiopsis mangrovi]|uniref:Uncharacterized protein n=1 Tax=Nocardiopsis mangrovi TaxID=1179818 RepID=A0ABV9DSH1_9ACTN
MQILESSIVGLRSAVIPLRRRGSPMRILLFPMVHVAEPAFYQDVGARLLDCHIVVAEGIRGESTPVSFLTMAYRCTPHNRRLGLIVQKLDVDALPVPVIRPDMTGPDFTKGWRRLPLRERAWVALLVPIVAAISLLAGSRAHVGDLLALDHDPPTAAEEAAERLPELHALVRTRREALLVEALSALHAEHGHEPIDVAVVYGAAHMPAVVTAMAARHGYLPRQAEWLTVFEY